MPKGFKKTKNLNQAKALTKPKHRADHLLGKLAKKTHTRSLIRQTAQKNL